jgi:hypothetical protein
MRSVHRTIRPSYHMCVCGPWIFHVTTCSTDHDNSCEKSNTSTEPNRNMSSNLPVDVLPMILKNLDKADLATMCRVNKVCCSFSQDILYRQFFFQNNPYLIWRTLAHSTHLARRVHSFNVFTPSSTMELNQLDNLATALRNMSSLRKLRLELDDKFYNILDGCTFKLDSFWFSLSCDEYPLKFLNSQPSLTVVGISNSSPDEPYDCSTVFDSTCLPNLTRISAHVAWLPHLIPARPVSDVSVYGYPDVDRDSINWNFFTLSTAPILELTMDQDFLYDKPAEFLASLFPSLVHLNISMTPQITKMCVDHFSIHRILY